MIRKGQLDQTGASAFKQFAGLAAKLRPVVIAVQTKEIFTTEQCGAAGREKFLARWSQTVEAKAARAPVC